ncbi:MAG: hypothetical protein B9S32_05965 [Verrucomicrobia bacterium Tous-C9LFEB]|nr:MAG: hypothetical protein B9S32_05965 [Verrucomicrobia bacterium Tous-C9LFEB]
MHLMKTPRWFSCLAVCVVAAFVFPSLHAQDSGKQIPDPLKSWQDWATWDEAHRRCPTPYFDASKHLCFWPSRLDLKLEGKSGQFELGLTVFHETWIPLLGGSEIWPFDVKANGAPVPVVDHNGCPAVQLKAGTYRLTGRYYWDEIPQRIAIPPEIGVLALTLNGKRVDAPTWDAEGYVWLKRSRAEEETDKNFLAVKVYRVIDDGIPMWLRTVVELSVSGKSREEVLGSVLPEGWQLAKVDSPLPVSIDEKGLLKVQVRAGKWIVRADAFRLNSASSFNYPSGVTPVVEEELVAFRSQPDFRMVEVRGVPSIDVTQTTFPPDWRDLPVYRWETKGAFQLEERMRGMGLQKPEGLRVARELWLDDNGRAFTFRDHISGNNQQIWRLDAAENQNLGSVRSNGQGQLITRNPQNNAPGVELRARNLNLEATGRMPRDGKISATGWRADADSLRVTVHLPPGWRLFALFGVDYVSGDWLTAWTLLDLFLLLVFSLAVYKLWGVPMGVLAFAAFGLAYMEPGAPRYLWLFLLFPLALLRVMPEGWLQRVVLAWKYVAMVFLLLALVPFAGRQIQSAIYPQLEAKRGYGGGLMPMAGAQQEIDFVNARPVASGAYSPATAMSPEPATNNESSDSFSLSSRSSLKAKMSKAYYNDNLQYDTKARIQTGPGVPDWQWRTVSFGWNGPVKASQQFHPILIPLPLQRLLTILRVGLLIALAALLLDARKWKLPPLTLPQGTRTAAFAALCSFGLFGFATTPAQAQIPDDKLIKTLHDRLLKPSDAYPNAADIPSVAITLRDKQLTIEAEIHAAVSVAVPLPGRLPAWSPVRVTIDGKTDAAVRRDDGYLWVALPAGVHRVRVEGQLANVTEWEWAFQLKPHRVTIDAPGWTYTGVRPDGTPESQVFFAQKQKSATSEASYERQDLRSVAVLDRSLELGLVWQVRNTVKRLSPPGRAISLRIPLLPREKVLSATETVKDGYIEVRLGAQESEFSWESELTIGKQLVLATQPNDAWIERWKLVASPVWNVSFAGLAPVFEPSQNDLVPTWQPWPGEKVTLNINRPEAINGATVTVQNVTERVRVGERQRTTNLTLKLQCSVGEDFIIGLPAEAEVTSLTQNDKTIPVRKDGTKLVVPLRPGEQQINMEWKSNIPLGLATRTEAIQLPVESTNISTTVELPSSRWVLWTCGPLRGPAVRLWGILAVSLVAAWLLGKVPFSPLRPTEWALLVIGLTQVALVPALLVIGWFFALVLRGQEKFQQQRTWLYNAGQLVVLALTVVMLASLLQVVHAGLLGRPDMFIEGNGSDNSELNWFLARTALELPQPFVLSVSIWWYRLLMLLWSLWLATALLRWLKWGWAQFSTGSLYRTIWNDPTPPSQEPPSAPKDY